MFFVLFFSDWFSTMGDFIFHPVCFFPEKTRPSGTESAWPTTPPRSTWWFSHATMFTPSSVERTFIDLPHSDLWFYLQVGQLHGGPFRWLQTTLAKAHDHIWFERAETKDRSLVAQRMRNHVLQPTKPPILIFPEGSQKKNHSLF